MTDAHTQVAPAPAGSPGRLDVWLNVALFTLVVALVALAAWFGYSVWQNYQRTLDTSPSSRVIGSLEDQVRKAPNDVILRVRLGEALGSAGRYPQAIEQLNAALKIDPKHVGAYLDLGMIAFLTDKDAEAEEYFKKVIELTETADFRNVDERRENALYNLGQLKLRQESYEEAAGYFKSALRIRKDASDTYVNLARALKGMEDYDAAIGNLEIALQFDPGFAEAHYLMGQLYQAKKDDVNASYYFYQAAMRAPDADPPQEALAGYGPSSDWVARARKARAEGDIEAALTDALVARNLDPQNLVATKLHGEILLDRGDVKDAVEVYVDALGIDAKDKEVDAALSRLEKDSRTATVRVYRAVLKQDPGNDAVRARLEALKK